MKDIQDFIEKYYPNYSSCNKISESDDYQKIIDGEINGQAKEIYDDLKFNECYTDEAIIETAENRMHKLNSEIYAAAIENYIEILNYKKTRS